MVEAARNERQRQHVEGCERVGRLLLATRVRDQLFAEVVSQPLAPGFRLLEDFPQSGHHFSVAGLPLGLVTAHRLHL